MGLRSEEGEVKMSFGEALIIFMSNFLLCHVFRFKIFLCALQGIKNPGCSWYWVCITAIHLAVINTLSEVAETYSSHVLHSVFNNLHSLQTLCTEPTGR